MASERIAWIDVSKGVCIAAVVSLYAVERLEVRGAADVSWMEHWVRFARPFRMPDFFLISGLFLSRVIDRPWRSYLDTKAVHYLYFFALWTLISFPFLVAAGKGGSTPVEWAHKLASMFWEPYAMLWFIQMLSFYFVLAKLLRPVPRWAVLCAAALWHLFPVESGWHQLERAGERFVFFYAGYALAPRFFRLADAAARRPIAALAALAAWAAVNQALVARGLADQRGFALGLGFLGACGVIALSSLLARTPAARPLAYLGERSIAIYLSFLIPLTALLLAAARLDHGLDRGTLAALATALSVSASLAFDRLTRGTVLRFLFERPRWARLASRDAVPAGAGAPAAT